jgi:hypothetical protein
MKCSPREVYSYYLDDLRELMLAGAGTK